MNFPSDVARTLAQMLEARLPGRAAEAAQDARVAPPLSEGVEAWMEVLLIADRAGAVRLAAVLADLAPGDPDIAVVRRELDGSRERLRRTALGVAVVGFGMAAGMLLFPGAGPGREVPAPVPVVPEPVTEAAPASPASVPTGTAALSAVPVAARPAAAPAAAVYGPTVPSATPASGVPVGPSPAAPVAPPAPSAAPTVYGPPLPPNWVPTPVPVVAPSWPAATYAPAAPAPAPAPAAPASAPAAPTSVPPVAPAPAAP